MTSVSSANDVGHTSGHCVNPKNTTTTLPAKSDNWRVLPLVSVSSMPRPSWVPLMSLPLNVGALSPQAARAAAKAAAAPKRRASRRLAENTDINNLQGVSAAGRPSGPPAGRRTAAPGREWKNGTCCAPAGRCRRGTGATHTRRTCRPAPKPTTDTARRSCGWRRATASWPPAPRCTAGYAGV
ncbi:hypothetical protein G6F35_014425 [Rhizopus arrhizus]|nr:hypothetical protein G6F35_014425 [Rhizopus arrhizus]